MLAKNLFWSLFTVCSALPALIACRASAVGPGPDGCEGPADSLLTLCVGQEVRPQGGAMRIAFLAVRSDSRCPVDVVCVWQGNAEVEIGVAFGAGPTVPYALNTGVGARSVVLGIYRLTLVGLRPDPVSTTTIPPDRYVVSLRLERLSGSGSTGN